MDLTSITPSPQQMKALTHPVRVRMLGMLRIDGPATATTLAARLGLNTGATSYHLRQLAQHGFVVEDAERGNARDRWWKAAHRFTRTELTRPADPDAAETLDAYLQSVVVVMTQNLQRSVEELPLLPAEWRDATSYNDWVVRLTPGPGAGARREARRAARRRGRGGRRRRRAVRRPAQRLPVPRQGGGHGRGRRMSTRRPLYGWLTAEAISLTGTRVSMVALPWFVLTTTGSATKTGLVALAEMLPLVVLKVLGGPVIDRVGARRVAITCDLLSVLAVGAIPLLHEPGWLSFPVFLLLVALAGALRGPGDAAKAAMTPAVVAEAGVPMERATGLHSTVERTAGLLGAAAAGGLVAWLGAADALVVDALSFGLSAARARLGDAGSTATGGPGSRRTPTTPTPYLDRAARGLDVPARRPDPAGHRGDGLADQPPRHGVRRRPGAGLGGGDDRERGDRRAGVRDVRRRRRDRLGLRGRPGPTGCRATGPT